MSNERGEVSDATREAEAEEGRAPHVADRAASAEEEELIKDNRVDDEVREHFQEMSELGANDPGEGRIP